MSGRLYDAIVIGTGAGGGMAIHALCARGLDVLALNAGRRLDPARDFRGGRMPWDLVYRGFGDPRAKGGPALVASEFTRGLWEQAPAHTNAAGSEWVWPRCHAVGGKTNFWGRSAARFGSIDFRAASLDAVDVDWPVEYDEIAPYYERVERMIGVASTRQGRPSNPDGVYLDPVPFRCLDHILKAGADTLGLPYVPDRVAQLTVPHAGRPKCHYCGHCSDGCDTGSFFSSPFFLLPEAERSGRLEMRTNAVARHLTVDADGRATGVAYVDRATREEVEVRARAIVLAASCLETTRILLNSRSRHWPAGLANSSGELGRNLCDHLYGTAAYGCLPQLLGQPSAPDDASGSTIAWMPRFQNLRGPREEAFVRGYALYPAGGCAEFPGYHAHLEGFGADFKRAMKRYYPTPVSLTSQVPTLPAAGNAVTRDPTATDELGIPALRISFAWGDNELRMWRHARETAAALLAAAGGELWGQAEDPEPPGYSLHEVGTCRMGNDPRRFVTNRFGQCHDVRNVFCCDASVFPSPTDKTTTLSILAFSLRSSEYLVEMLKGTI